MEWAQIQPTNMHIQAYSGVVEPGLGKAMDSDKGPGYPHEAVNMVKSSNEERADKKLNVLERFRTISLTLRRIWRFRTISLTLRRIWRIRTKSLKTQMECKI